MAEALGPRRSLRRRGDAARVLTKVIRYTGGRRRPVAPGRPGRRRHRDTGFLTFVHQDGVGGLQVERDGGVTSRRGGTLVVNIGEMFQLVTNGYFKATVHRVVSPPPGVERISMASSQPKWRRRSSR